MNRRNFITLLGGGAPWPLAARAQRVEGIRRIGFLSVGAENDVGLQAQRTALLDGLAKLGWIEGRNLRVEIRFAAGDLDRIRSDATELVRLAPEVIVISGGAAVKAVQEKTQTIPIVMAVAGDPAATGLVRNIARPEGNTTGFGVSEPSIAGKWLGLLKEAAPHVSRVAVIFNPDIAQTASNYITSIEAAAPALSVQTITTPVHDAVDVVRAIDAFATAPNGGLVVLPPQSITAIFSALLRVATEHRLPAVYSGGRTVAAAGGLVAYGSDNADLARRAADYVDRLLRGAKVADLPIQFPTKYDLVINLRTARAIGLNIPATLRLRADEVIE